MSRSELCLYTEVVQVGTVRPSESKEEITVGRSIHRVYPEGAFALNWTEHRKKKGGGKEGRRKEEGRG